jgi:hypothetical protein
MRDDDDYEDEDDLDDRRASGRPSFPGIVRAAGIIWIGVGGLELLNAVANAVMAGMNQNQNPGSVGGVCCAGGIGIAFLVCGIQTVTGKATDTLGNAIGSLALGLLLLGLGVLVGFGGAILGANPNANANANGLPAVVFVILGVITSVLGLTLILAGVLALMGRARYKEWRQANFPSSRSRRRRPRDDDEDEDEEPRRRRRDEDEDDEPRRRRRDED